jgi:phosphate transport system permease protein
VTTSTKSRRAEKNTTGPSSARAKRRSYLVLEVAGSLVVALGITLVVRVALDLSNLWVLLALGYVTFVAVVAFIELAAADQSGRPHIDLTREQGSDLALREPPTIRSVPDTTDLPDKPLRRRSVSGPDLVEAGVAALVAGGVAEVVRVVLRMQSLVGVAIWGYVAFIAIYFLLVRDRSDAEGALDRVVTMLVWSAALLVVSVLGWMMATVVSKGATRFTWDFLTHDLSTTGPLDPGGGAQHAIIGTAEQVGIATLVVIPLGILTAVYLHEIRGRIARPIRFIVDAMSGLPSIVAGLLIYTVWSSGHGYSGIAGSAALAVLMLPTMTRATEEILRTVPDTLREGALALGAPQWRLVQSVVLPTALAGIVTASLLAVARAIGETAPMLFSAFGADATNVNPLHGPQADLPLFIFKLIFLPNQNQIDRAWTGALILVGFVLVLFVSARLVARRGIKRLGGTR